MSRTQDIPFDQLKSLYFLGIGGIGMSALARYFNQRGVMISGYDRTETDLTKKLVSEGMDIHYHADVNAVPDNIDLVIYTPAVPQTNPEWDRLVSLGVPILKRAEVLGLISRNSRTIAVAGTHGKTTTSTILAHLLQSGGVDCTAFLGGISRNFGSNYVAGDSDWVVVEADEFDRSFLHLRPELACIMSTDPDHLDIYGDHDAMLSGGFERFAGLVGGNLYVQTNALPNYAGKKELRRFGLEGGLFRAENIRVVNGHFRFDYIAPGLMLQDLRTPLAGRHNVENAVAAICLALEAGVKPEHIAPGLASFKGIQRRFERIFESPEQVYIDDYAHHPTELEAAIRAARDLFPGRKITGVFQPHLYSRTRIFTWDLHKHWMAWMN